MTLLLNLYDFTHYRNSSNNNNSNNNNIIIIIIAKTECLQTLNLSWNHLRMRGAQAVAFGLEVGLLGLS